MRVKERQVAGNTNNTQLIRPHWWATAWWTVMSGAIATEISLLVLFVEAWDTKFKQVQKILWYVMEHYYPQECTPRITGFTDTHGRLYTFSLWRCINTYYTLIHQSFIDIRNLFQIFVQIFFTVRTYIYAHKWRAFSCIRCDWLNISFLFFYVTSGLLY